ncbi:OPT family oligopeptide transporter [Stutzerimonas urumqiensis]|uniref:OPT family oligopeptide transporter n=1 Tax=Stutzerimonas urumqiensis TaxID=638269 RepID=UPI000EAF4BD2|nr:OPT family oligopeptide transporter [Stutzerimonas urumqiensis]
MADDRELTLRALLTGLVLGALLTPSNIYSGLKIGWSFNMSIIALLVGFAIWQGLAARLGGPRWSRLESNITQTSASAAASIISSGLVAPIPAYTLITGESLPWGALTAWVFSVSLLGVWVAWYLRPSLIVRSALRFPEGMATLATLEQVYGHGREASKRLAVLAGAASLAAAVKLADLAWRLPRWAPSPSLERLTFAFEPSLLLVGFGGIVGLRVGLSLLVGALLAWGLIAPWLVAEGLVRLPPDAQGPQFALLIEWLLWPGVALMVCATLVSLGVRTLRAPDRRTRTGPRRLNARPLLGLLVAGGLVVSLQVGLFGIGLLMALLSIPLSVLLAMVAARVVGATGIPPIGAIGQVSQLGFGVLAPGQVAINLMSANTAGGAAGQCTDLLNDFKVGHALGAHPGRQVVAQCLGIVIGSLVGVVTYQALIPDPQAMLITPEWPAPAVATWKAVAEALTGGLAVLTTDVRLAMLAGAVAGLLLGLLDALAPPPLERWLPSAAALGLAFIIPASISLTMAFGALLAWLFMARWRSLGERFVIVAAAGLVAGESMAGVGVSLWQLLS